MAITTRHFAVALFASALLGSAVQAGEGHNLFGDWFSKGSEEFDKGTWTNVEVDSSENLGLGRTEFGEVATGGLFVSAIQPAGESFDTVTVGFDAEAPEGSQVNVQIRAFRGGEHSRWYDVEPESDIIFPQEYRFLQYRVQLRSLDGQTRPRFRLFTAMFGKMAGAIEETEDGFVANKAAPKPEITSRAGWGAKPHKGGKTKHTPKYLIVHHSSVPDAAAYKGAVTVRGIQRFHQVDRGWADVGYHFLIGPEGQIYQGRPETIRGAHCTPNTGKVGICLIGNHHGKDPVTAKTKESLVKLLAFLASKYNINPTSRIKGHRDFNSTNCPGKDAYAGLGAIREAVKDALN